MIRIIKQMKGFFKTSRRDVLLKIVPGEISKESKKTHLGAEKHSTLTKISFRNINRWKPGLHTILE